MNHAHMREWIDDLRANPDMQGKNRLTGIFYFGTPEQEERDCCLGRVCKLAELKKVIMNSTEREEPIRSIQYISDVDIFERSGISGELNSETDLPRSAKVWLGLQWGDPYIIDIYPLIFAEKITRYDMAGKDYHDWVELEEDETSINASSANDDLDFSFGMIADCLEWNYMYKDGVLIA